MEFDSPVAKENYQQLTKSQKATVNRNMLKDDVVLSVVHYTKEAEVTLVNARLKSTAWLYIGKRGKIKHEEYKKG